MAAVRELRYCKTKEFVQSVAKENEISAEEMEQRIESEIHAALHRTVLRDDGIEGSLWADISHNGTAPTAYELVEFLAEKVAEYPNRRIIWK